MEFYSADIEMLMSGRNPLYHSIYEFPKDTTGASVSPAGKGEVHEDK
jgi:hypothetical protein